MRSYLTWFLLLLHFNGAMFFPWVGEKDDNAPLSHKVDNVSSVLEYFKELLWGADKMPEQQGDDNERSSLSVRIHHVIVCVVQFTLSTPMMVFDVKEQQQFPPYHWAASSRSFDVLGPPPRA